jgi:hypothetical protein
VAGHDAVIIGTAMYMGKIVSDTENLAGTIMSDWRNCLVPDSPSALLRF